ncbi:MAG: glycosyltransferase [Desulfovibrio sp.]|jgi:glycosyltransferase involved in cell wall biosynthesis|nr:glycosyltransferase [Desulfovibrio sp.]
MTAASMDLSIIIPLYNLEDLLPRCLDSIVQQQSPLSIECIVIDDGSTDSSLDIAREYAQRYPFVHVYAQQNSGAGVARNKGLELAKGRYVCFVDSDDYLCNDSLLHFSGMVNSVEQPDVIIFDFYVEDVNQNKSRCHSITRSWLAGPALRDNIPRDTVFALCDYPELLLFCRRGAPWNKIYRRAFLREHNVRFATSRVAEDWLFFVLSLLTSASIKIIEKPLYVQFINRPGSQCTSVYGERRLTQIDVFDESLRIIDQLAPPPPIKNYLLLVMIGSVSFFGSRTPEPWHASFKNYLDYLVSLLPQGDLAQKLRDRLIDPQPNFKNPTATAYLKMLYKYLLKNDDEQRPLLSIILTVNRSHSVFLDQYFNFLNSQFECANICEVIIAHDAVADNIYVSSLASKKFTFEVSSFSVENDSSPYLESLRHAKGEYVCFMDPTILPEPESLQPLLLKAICNDADLLITQLDMPSRFLPEQAENEKTVWKKVIKAKFSKLSRDRQKCLLWTINESMWRNIYKRKLLIGILHNKFPENTFDSPLLLHWMAIDSAEHIVVVPQKKFSKYFSEKVDHRSDLIKNINEMQNTVPFLLKNYHDRFTKLAITYRLLRLLQAQALSDENAISERNVLLSLTPPIALTDLTTYKRLFHKKNGIGKTCRDYFVSHGLYNFANYQAVLKLKNNILDKLWSILKSTFKLLSPTYNLLLSQQRKLEDLKKDIDAMQERNHKLSNSIRWALSASVHHQRIFPRFKNLYSGRDVVLIATGPTLNRYQPIAGAVHIGVNRAFKADFIQLDYLFVQDFVSAQGYLNDLPSSPNASATIFYGLYEDSGRTTALIIPEDLTIKHGAVRYYCHPNRMLPPMLPLTLNIDREPLVDNGSVVSEAMQFVFYTNPKKIFLVGCDCSLDSHFNGDAQFVTDIQRRNKIMINTRNNVWEGIKRFSEIYYPDTEIISINPVGLKGIFKDYYYDV